MKLYELFKGTEYVGEFTLDEIISITEAHCKWNQKIYR